MSTSQILLEELEREAVGTKKILEVVPFDKADWKPHEKSMTLVQLSHHIAGLIGWVDVVVNTNELDLTDYGKSFKQPKSSEELMKEFSDNLTKSVQSLEKTTDEALQQLWTLRMGEQVYFELPKVAVIRTMCFNHAYHHRGQLGVYLRLLDVKVPGIYGPTADEM